MFAMVTLHCVRFCLSSIGLSFVFRGIFTSLIHVYELMQQQRQLNGIFFLGFVM